MEATKQDDVIRQLRESLTRKQTAEALGVTEGTLAVWASKHRYPLPYTKIGRLVRYRKSDVEEFIRKEFIRSRTVSGGE